MKKIRFRESLLPFGIILCAALWTVKENISRFLWFDEVITTAGFALHLDFQQIYLRYNIPNNHILFTYLLKLFVNIWSEIFAVVEWTFRLPSVGLSIISLWILFRFVGKKAGKETAIIAGILFALSMPFAIYSVAIRGYMMSFLFVLLSYVYCEKILRRKKDSAFILYFIFTLIAVGTIPSNIAMLLPIPFIAARYRRLKELLNLRFIMTLALPVTALILFYLPIYKKFLANMKLKEGWPDHIAAVGIVYAAFGIAFLPLILTALIRVFNNKSFRIDIIARLAVFFIPAAVCLVTEPSPFPRVFFSLWALWIPLSAWTAAPLIKKLLSRFSRESRLIIAVLIATAWALSCGMARENLSRWMAENKGLDDYFYPYYMHKDFDPPATVRKIKQVSGNSPVPFYASFNADPYSLSFYWNVMLMPDGLFLFDGPGMKIPSIKNPLSLETFIAVRDESELSELLKRFPCKSLQPVDTSRYQKIYAVTPE